MKPKNFPARKLKRQMEAKLKHSVPKDHPDLLDARAIRTKIRRGAR